MNELRIGASLVMDGVNTPTRKGEIVSSLEEIYNIPTPYVGMKVWCGGKAYIVTELEGSEIAGVFVPELKVKSFEALVSESELANEVSRAQAAEKSLQSNIAAEVERATAQEQQLQKNINAEIARAQTAEGKLREGTTARFARFVESAAINAGEAETFKEVVFVKSANKFAAADDGNAYWDTWNGMDEYMNGNEVRKDKVYLCGDATYVFHNGALRDRVAELIGEAPDTLDSIHEIADWINNDKSGAAAMAAQIGVNKVAIEAEKARAQSVEQELQSNIGAEKSRAEGAEAELREKMLEGDELNSRTLSELKNIIEGGETDLADNIVWTKGAWSFSLNAGAGSEFIKQTYHYSNKIDISEYSSVNVSGLKNGGPMSIPEMRYPTITYFGDGNQIAWEDYEDGETFIIRRSDYAGYKKLEIVVLAFQSEEIYVPSVRVTGRSLQEDIRELKDITKVLETGVDEIKGSVQGMDDVELVNTLSWTKGAWSFTNNAGPGSSFMQETYRYVRIDISNYDYVTLSGLKNGGPMSTPERRYPTISIYGDSKPIEYKQVEDGDTYVLYTHDYNIFKKIEIVILAYQSEDVYTPSVKVNKNSVFEGQFIPKRIVICGDSLTGNESSLVTLQLNSIAKSQGYSIIRNSMGGENIIGNLTRNGGIGIRVKSDFIMPQEGIVDIEVESAWMMSSGEYAHNPYNNLYNRAVVIMGVEGTLTRNSETSYTFSRNAAGEEFKVGAGTIFWDNALWTCRDYPHIWFTGQNGGYDNDAEWADMINMAARNFGENFIVCSTALSRTTAELVRCATIKFGNKYLNLKAYTEGQAVYDGQRFGLIDSSKLASDYAELFWPGEDKVHQNNLLSYMWAVLMWNTLVDLGYVKGKQVNGGEYYIP